jgi:sporulation protein YlmC with PRC-barrel domain
LHGFAQPVAVSWEAVDEGLPIAYEVLEKGVPVLASDGQQVGTVHHVVAAPEKDIFHGLVITAPQGRRFVEAADVASLHERGVDLKIDSAAAQGLPEPGGGAPIYDEDPGAMKGWHHWVHLLGMRGDWHREP